MTKTDDVLTRAARVQRIEQAPNEVRIGEWYWVDSDEQDEKGKKTTTRRLATVTHIGSNFVRLTAPVGQWRDSESSWSIHFDEFDGCCTPEPDAPAIIQQQIDLHRGEVRRLMGEVMDLTARLSVSPRDELTAGSETEALSLRDDGTSLKDYKQALIKAEKETLPQLFKAIEHENNVMARWLKAPLLALRGQLDAIKPVVKAIEARIFNVEIYAGLIEEVKQVTDGAPADLQEPIRLFQRRHYMDEECLLNYTAGGMKFQHLDDFDDWLARPENRDRILPFPRCVVAFKVRRRKSEWDDDVPLAKFISMVLSGETEAYKKTYIYMRNGEQVYRLRTGIEFDEQLFPSLSASEMETGKIYWNQHADRRERLLSEAQLAALRAQEDAEQEAKNRQRLEDNKKRPAKDHYPANSIFYHVSRASERYIEWSKDNVHYDEIAAHVQAQIDHHNRVVMILQGLLDRSPVFHPHPRWQLWTPDGMAMALRLLYDDDRALTTGIPPDFEAYRQRLNASLKAGAVVTGQEDVWLQREAERENTRQRRDYRIRNHSNYKRYRPTGNPGPGLVARCTSVTKAVVRFQWKKERVNRWGDPVEWGETTTQKALAVPRSAVLNVDAYTVGDYKQFYADPRTRADYLQWAPLLLAAEDYHAGKLKIEIGGDDE